MDFKKVAAMVYILNERSCSTGLAFGFLTIEIAIF